MEDLLSKSFNWNKRWTIIHVYKKIWNKSMHNFLMKSFDNSLFSYDFYKLFYNSFEVSWYKNMCKGLRGWIHFPKWTIGEFVVANHCN